ncbi:MAG: hypothetical protein ACXWHF_00435 [Chthoniobacterales bacterium]
MERTLILTLGGLLFLCEARADLQLVPTLTEYELDGVKLKQAVFPDGDTQVSYTPPSGWSYSGSKNVLVLHPPDYLKAEAKIKVAKLPEVERFDEVTIKRLSEELVASLPNGATRVTVTQQTNPLLIERKETCLFVISYDFNMESYVRSVMLLNRKDEQVRFELICLKPDFPALQKAFQGSHYSWQNL